MSFLFRRASQPESPRSSTARFASALKSGTRVEDLRKTLNSLHDMLGTLEVTPELMDALVRVLRDFDRDGGLVTSVLGLLAEEQSFKEEVKEAFVKASGVETMAVLLKSAAISNTNRIYMLRMLKVMLRPQDVMLYTTTLSSIIEHLRNPAVHHEALSLFLALFSQPANLAELQKIAVFEGALDTLLRLLPVEKDAWNCLRLLLNRNAMTRNAFLEEHEGLSRLKETPNDDCRVVMLRIAALLIQQTPREKREKLRAAMQRQQFGETAVNSIRERKDLLKASLDFLTLLEMSLPEETAKLITKLALEGDHSAIRLYETVIRSPLNDFNSPYAYRLHASAPKVTLEMHSLVESLRSNDFSLVGLLYAFIVMDVNLMSEGLLIQLLLEHAMLDEGLTGGLCSCLLLNQLRHQNRVNSGYSVETLKSILMERIGAEELLSRLEAIRGEDERLNFSRIAPFIETARRKISGEPEELKKLIEENDMLRAQVQAYQVQILALEEEHTRVLGILGQYDAEIATLKVLLSEPSPLLKSQAKEIVETVASDEEWYNQLAAASRNEDEAAIEADAQNLRIVENSITKVFTPESILGFKEPEMHPVLDTRQSQVYYV